MTLVVSRIFPLGGVSENARYSQLKNLGTITSLNNLTSKVILSGGIAIPFNLMGYEAAVASKLSQMQSSEHFQDVMQRWFPPYLHPSNNWYYRDHSAIHLACMTQDISAIIGAFANPPKSKKTEEQIPEFRLFHRKRVYAKGFQLKLESYSPVSPEEAVKIGANQEEKEFLTSNLLRLCKINSSGKPVLQVPMTDYFDLFVHQYEDHEGVPLVERNSRFFKKQVSRSEQEVAAESVNVRCLKDNLTVSRSEFTPSIVKLELGTFAVANPAYIYRAKYRRLIRKKGDSPKDALDLEILKNMMHFFEISTQDLEKRIVD